MVFSPFSKPLKSELSDEFEGPCRIEEASSAPAEGDFLLREGADTKEPGALSHSVVARSKATAMCSFLVGGIDGELAQSFEH